MSDQPDHFDVLLLGTGSGNSVLSEDYEHLRVCVVERDVYGGTCLNRGCIPSKMYVLPADAARSAREGERLDLSTSYDGVAWRALRDRIFGRIDPIAASGRSYREGQDNVTALHGTARLVDPHTAEVTLDDGSVVTVTADQVVIATGGRPVVPDIEGVDQLAEHELHTSDTVMRIDELPRRVGIIGGGYVGCEFAHVFSSLGAEVVQVDSGPALIDHEDDDVAELFTRLASERYDVRLNSKLEKVSRDERGITLALSDGSTAEVDLMLMAVGRQPNNDQLGVAEAGIEVDGDGLVVVDEHQRASVQGVWALGDASSPLPLKHLANQDARVVSHNLLHPDDLHVSDHRFVPHAVFSSPQVAAVGLTEREARQQGLDYAVATHAFADVAYGWAENDDSGHFVKLLADRATGLLVGAHLIGPNASMLIQPLIQAMSFDQPVAGLARGQYWIHPALTEVVEGALLDLEKELG